VHTPATPTEGSSSPRKGALTQTRTVPPTIEQDAVSSTRVTSHARPQSRRGGRRKALVRRRRTETTAPKFINQCSMQTSTCSSPLPNDEAASKHKAAQHEKNLGTAEAGKRQLLEDVANGRLAAWVEEEASSKMRGGWSVQNCVQVCFACPRREREFAHERDLASHTYGLLDLVQEWLVGMHDGGPGRSVPETRGSICLKVNPGQDVRTVSSSQGRKTVNSSTPGVTELKWNLGGIIDQ
jgi:hypothetical protein